MEEADCRFEGVEGECEGELFGAFNLFQFEDSSILQRLKAEYAEMEANSEAGRELKGLRSMPNDLAKKLVSRDSTARSSSAIVEPPSSKEESDDAALPRAPTVQRKRVRVDDIHLQKNGGTRHLHLQQAPPIRLKLVAPNYSAAQK